MRYENICRGRFLARPNRFVARVEIDGAEVVCHVKNTGRCRELLVPGAAVYLEQASNPKRKTACDLVAVEKGNLLINMDAQAPNKVFGEFAAAGGFLPGLTALRPEHVWEDSRFDFLLEDGKGPILVEVKGVTLEREGEVLFPDAPTERGVKHIRELQRALAEGYDSYLAFVIQMEGITEVRPNDETHPAFGQALREAAAAGVQVLCLPCAVEKDSLTVKEALPCGLSL